MSFTHLQVRSGYSLMESTVQINQLVDRAKKLNFTSLALTDFEVMHGAISFYQACLQQGIKPLLGMTMIITHANESIECTLLAKNNLGYQNLLAITSHIQTKDDSFSLTDLQGLSSGLFCLATFTHLNNELLTGLQTTFIEHFYLKINTSHIENKNEIEAFVKEHKLQLVIANEVRFLEKRDLASYDCLQAMKNGDLWEKNRIDLSMQNAYLLSKEEASKLYDMFPQAIKNTERIAAECHVELEFNQQLLPKFPLDDETSKIALKRLCFEGLAKKYEEKDGKVLERLNHELKIIDELGFNDYFLIVADLVGFAKSSGITVGPGRGSAAGSIVAYLLNITMVDPLKYDLLFERFLNPNRATMPDIDIDFSDERREEVIEYVKEKYGDAYVAKIVTFGTFGPRSLMRELMKTMDIDLRDQAYVLKNISTQSNQNLVSLLKKNEDFSTYVKQSNSLKQLFVHAITLEGLPRHASTHAAGLILTDEPLIKHVPVMNGPDDVKLTQYAMNELESLGLLKIDLLGLRNLSLIEHILDSIKRTTHQTLNLSKIPKDDKKTFELLQKGKTNGVFQLESDGMKRVLKQLKPTALTDIVALNALYRPGPMDQIPTFINRKFNKEPVTYIHPDLEPILKDTYGVLVYQEQIMKIAHEIAGFTLGEADLLRRAVSKKDTEVMRKLENQFLNGCKKSGYTAEVGEEIFSWINRFANYGFNKSHSVAYSKISYDLSYLKANYPTNFFAELLSTTLNQPAKFAMYIHEAKELGIEILPPSINHSFGRVTVEGECIRIGLIAIKGIGHQSVKEIVRARKEGPFSDLFDFYLKTSSEIIKRNIIEMLIKVGTFDEIYPNRASLLVSIDQAESRAELFGDIDGNSDSLFSKGMKLKPSYIEKEDFSLLEKLAEEKELVGVYLSAHPLSEYRLGLTQAGFVSLKEIHTHKTNRTLKLSVVVQEVRKIRTKRGESMAFITISDETTESEAVVFPETYRNSNLLLFENAILELSIKLTERNNDKQIIVNKIKELNLDEQIKQLFIKVKPELADNVYQEIKELIKNEPGDIPMILHFEETKKTFKLNDAYLNSGSDVLMSKLHAVFGVENVVLNIKKRYHS